MPLILDSLTSPLESYSNIKKLDTPIMIYKIVHTIGNKNPGGARGGFATISN